MGVSKGLLLKTGQRAKKGEWAGDLFSLQPGRGPTTTRPSIAGSARRRKTIRVLARLSDPTIVIGARISELLGLKWRHIELRGGVIQIVQRNWRGDIDDPKSKTSERPLSWDTWSTATRVKANADNVDRRSGSSPGRRAGA
jgi:integrase